MLPLQGPVPPANHSLLIEQLQAGLESLAGGNPRVELDARNLRIQLESPKIAPGLGIRSSPHPESARRAIEPDHFQLGARNALLWGSAIDLDAQFVCPVFHWAPGDNSHSLLILSSAQSGSVRARIRQADLDALLFHHLRGLAESQGLELQTASAELTPLDPPSASQTHREIGVRIRLSAKAFIMQAALTLEGRVRVTDDLSLEFSDLRCEGQGMAATAAKAFLSPTFRTLEGAPVRLAKLLPPGPQLRSLELQCGPVLTLMAGFGSGTP